MKNVVFLGYSGFTHWLISSVAPTTQEKVKLIPVTQTKTTTYKQFNPKEVNIQFFLKNEEGQNYSSLKNVKQEIEKNAGVPVMLMNGGMYLKDQSPQGLYIENGVQIKPMDTTQTAYGNFYMQPNGVFYITNDGTAGISTSNNFSALDVKYATQSGPMLLVDRVIHPKFTKGSTSTHYRNGVGILPDGQLVFAISTEKVNFYDFATFFKDQGCINALYLDGFVSRAWFADSSIQQLEGGFGVIIGVWEKEN